MAPSAASIVLQGGWWPIFSFSDFLPGNGSYNPYWLLQLQTMLIKSNGIHMGSDTFHKPAQETSKNPNHTKPKAPANQMVSGFIKVSIGPQSWACPTASSGSWSSSCTFPNPKRKRGCGHCPNEASGGPSWSVLPPKYYEVFLYFQIDGYFSNWTYQSTFRELAQSRSNSSMNQGRSSQGLCP